LSAGVLALAPAAAFAQEVPATTTNTPAADSIGPKTLQNFSLKGTVTQQAQQPVTVAPAPAKRQPQAQVSAAPVEPSSSLADGAAAPAGTATPAPAPRRTQVASVSPTPQQRSPEQAQQSPPSSSPATQLPNVVANIAPPTAPPVTPAGSFAPAPATPGTLAPEHGVSFLPWLLAALALVLGGGFLFWRSRGREAFAGAGGPQVDAFVAPKPVPAAPPRRAPPPAPAPAPSPAPQPKPPGAPVGLVSTRLRPWIDIGFHPLRCVLDDERLTVEFEMELFNSGSAPARGVLVEASLFNAGPTQEQEIGNFFANPVAQGERIAAIQPLKRIGFKTQIVVPREQVRGFELGGRQVFVPLIAFNALYGWGSSEGQTSAAYMLGRDTKGEKMAPFRLDLGPRIFRAVGNRLMPGGVRR
jgi:hypothetical protein